MKIFIVNHFTIQSIPIYSHKEGILTALLLHGPHFFWIDIIFIVAF